MIEKAKLAIESAKAALSSKRESFKSEEAVFAQEVAIVERHSHFLARYDELKQSAEQLRGQVESFCDVDVANSVVRNLTVDSGRLEEVASKLASIHAIAEHKAEILEELKKWPERDAGQPLREYERQHAAVLRKFGEI